MKNLLIASIILLFAACGKDPVPTPTPQPQPKPATVGNYTLGGSQMSIDTTNSVAEFSSSDSSLTVILSTSSGNSVYTAGVYIKKGGTGNFPIVIGGDNMGNLNTIINGDVKIYTEPCDSATYTPGNVTISKYDLANLRVSGSFSFDVCGNGTKKEIRNGAFTDVRIKVE